MLLARAGCGKKVLIGLLCWYDERPDVIQGMVRSLVGVCDRLVALDGAYRLFPGGKPTSPFGQAAALEAVCEECDIRLWLELPLGRWRDECRKRTRAFEMGDQWSTSGDWLFVIDADERVVRVPADLLERLAASELPTGWCGRTDTLDLQPRLVRAGLGVRIELRHERWVTADGRFLWGRPFTDPVVLGEDMSGLVIEHVGDEVRGVERRARQSAYYRVPGAA